MGQSRNENILENILGAQNEIPKPVSRIETLLIQILEQGAIGGSGELVATNDNGTITLSIE